MRSGWRVSCRRATPKRRSHRGHPQRLNDYRAKLGALRLGTQGCSLMGTGRWWGIPMVVGLLAVVLTRFQAMPCAARFMCAVF